MTSLKYEKEEMTDKEFYERMYQITTDRIMELQSMKNDMDRGRRIHVPQYIFNNTWRVNQYLHQYAYMMLKGLQ